MVTMTEFDEHVLQVAETPESFSRRDRADLLKKLRERASRGKMHWATHLVLTVLSQDKYISVRLEAAAMLRFAPDPTLDEIVPRLRKDSSPLVRRATRQSLKVRSDEEKRIQHARRKSERVRKKLRELGRQLGEKQLALIMEIIEYEQMVVVQQLIHDLRGFFVRVGSLSYRMLQTLDDIDKVFYQEALEEIQRHVKHISSVSDDMKNFVGIRNKTVFPEAIDSMLNEARNMALEQARSHHGKEVDKVRVEMAVQDCPGMEVSRHELVLALSNVIQNAIDAVLDSPRKKGEVTVSARPMPHSKTKDIAITIEDNGTGISEEILDVLKKGVPGFTSKQGYGTGYGVAIAQRTIQRCGGTMTIESDCGKGTCIKIALPRKNQQREQI